MDDLGDRIEFLLQEWDGSALEHEDGEILKGAIPAMAEAFHGVAPEHFPDGRPTHASRLLTLLASAAVRAVDDARADGNYQVVHDLWLLMLALKQPQAMPLTAGWVDVVARAREVLESRRRSEDKLSVEAAAQVNRRWWELNGQWEAFTGAMVAAKTPEEVVRVVIAPPQEERTDADAFVDKDGGGGASGTTTCPDCGGLVSARIEACPHCGCPVRTNGQRHDLRSAGRRGKGWSLAVVALIALALAVAVVVIVASLRPWAKDPPPATSPVAHETTDTGASVESVRVGLDPSLMALSPDGRRLYVTNMQHKSVTVLDTESGAPVARVRVGRLPSDISVSTDGASVYVSCLNGLYELDTARNTAALLHAYDLGPGATAAAPDGRTLYIGTYEGVDVMDTFSRSIVRRLAPGLDATILALSPRGSRLYVGDFLMGTVSAVNTRAGSIDGRVDTDSPDLGVELEVSPDGKHLYVLRSTGVERLNTNTLAGQGAASLGSSLTGLATSPDGRVLYVGDYRENNVTLIDTETMTPIRTIDVGYGPADLVAAPDGTSLYVSVASEHAVQKVTIGQGLTTS